MQKTHILILGGGYSGLMAARRLARKTRGQGVEITLVNGGDSFVERIRLHQVAARQDVKKRPIRRMLAGTGVNFVQGWATRIEPEQRRVSLQTADGGQAMTYDYLIYALGSFIDSSRVPGAAEYALSLSTEATALQLRQRLPEVAARQGKLIVIGGGLTGIEASTELAEAYPDLQATLITREAFGAQLSKQGQAYLQQVFERHGIRVIENAAVSRITPDQVEYNGGQIAYDVCLWAGAFAVPTLARESGLGVNGRGQVTVDEYLRSTSHPTVYAVGDAADLSDAIETPIRMACATAMPMGGYAADHLAAMLQGGAKKPYQFFYLFRCISLGRQDGLVQFVEADDTPKEQILRGWMGAKIKEMVCRYTVWQILNERLMLSAGGAKPQRIAGRVEA